MKISENSLLITSGAKGKKRLNSVMSEYMVNMSKGFPEVLKKMNPQ